MCDTYHYRLFYREISEIQIWHKFESVYLE